MKMKNKLSPEKQAKGNVFLLNAERISVSGWSFIFICMAQHPVPFRFHMPLGDADKLIVNQTQIKDVIYHLNGNSL